MNEELELNLDNLDQNADKQLQIKNRYQQLANDKRDLAQKNEQAEARAKAEEEGRIKAEKSLEFYKTFSQLSAKHPEATNFQDQILERVNKGMDAEEATVAVLYKEGKLGDQPRPQPKPVAAEGGSAITNVNIGEKSVNDLTMAEKLAELQELEKSGELQQALRQGINRT